MNSPLTGAGGGILGTHLLGWRPIGYVEWDDYCQRIIAARIRDGFIPSAPIFGDVREFAQSGAAAEYRGFAGRRRRVPGASHLAQQAAGESQRFLRHKRRYWNRQTKILFLSENVSRKAIDTAADDLEAMGYAVKCIRLSARDLGADQHSGTILATCIHQRRRRTTALCQCRSGRAPRLSFARLGNLPSESRVADGLDGQI